MRAHIVSSLAVTCCLMAAPAMADGWKDGRVTSYLWFPDTETTLATPYGDVTTELSISDALENLDFGVMVTGEVRNGRWSVIGDLVYLDVGASTSTPLELLHTKAEATTKLTVLAGYGLYRVHEGTNLQLDVGAGLRGGKNKLHMGLSGGSQEPWNFKSKDNWIDPVIAARLQAQFAPKLQGALTADYSNWGDSDETYQLLATVGYSFNDNWSLSGGYRYLRIDQEMDGLDYRLEMSGPLIGVNYNF